MGLFDKYKIQVGPDAPLDPKVALMMVVVSAIKCDGNFAEEEFTRLRAMCTMSPIFARDTAEQDLEVFDTANTALNALGDQALSRAVAGLPPHLRDTAFAFACDMVMADGKVATEEEKHMEKLAQALELSEQNAEAIIYTTLARHRTL
jgi:uncharacterized tellurite resistance protein B-like protein